MEVGTLGVTFYLEDGPFPQTRGDLHVVGTKVTGDVEHSLV